MKALDCGSGDGPQAIVVGSHIYYPRTFSKTLKSQLHLVCADTRGFVPALPHHTESNFTADKLVQDIEAMRTSLGADKIILIGHSIYAFMAIEYARTFPDKVSHLILIASSPIAGPEMYKEADRYFEESVCPQRKVALQATIQKFTESRDPSFVARMLSCGPKIWYDHNFDALLRKKDNLSWTHGTFKEVLSAHDVHIDESKAPSQQLEAFGSIVALRNAVYFEDQVSANPDIPVEKKRKIAADFLRREYSQYLGGIMYYDEQARISASAKVDLP